MRVAEKPAKIGALIKKVDEQVSLFVRLSAADERGTVRCISCENKLWWPDSDCAHFKDRDNMATRYYLSNLAPACQDCNRYHHYAHIEAWQRKMSPEQVKDLDVSSRSMMKFTKPELEELLSEFTLKVKELRKQKGL